jgi:predicted metal-binding membrane protein
MNGQPRATAQPSTALAGQRAASTPVGGQVAAVGTLLVLTCLAWVATDLRMAGMDSGPGSDPGSLGFFFSTWVVMMAAMMLPSIAPMVLAHRELLRRASRRGETCASALFVTGYLAAWGAAGAVGYAVLEAGRSLDGGSLVWDRAGRWAAAGALLLAALYELTPHKKACLARCRAPRAFLQRHWREGNGGALRMGVEQGGWCLGCCWALMAALFALGAMSLLWMALISLLIAAEKLLPWRTITIVGATALLAALGLGVALTPTRVPGLTVPHGMSAMRAMGPAAPSHMRMPASARTAPRAAAARH